jgi:hypothetical protein
MSQFRLNGNDEMSAGKERKGTADFLKSTTSNFMKYFPFSHSYKAVLSCSHWYTGIFYLRPGMKQCRAF